MVSEHIIMDLHCRLFCFFFSYMSMSVPVLWGVCCALGIVTYEALKLYCCSMIRWTSWRGLFSFL